MKKLLCALAAAVFGTVVLTCGAFALTVEQALELLELYYLREIPAAAKEAEDLDELFALLGDPYTYYMSREEYTAFLGSVEDTTDLVGIGVSIRCTPEGLLIERVLNGGSAEAAGLRAGDLITRVDGASCVPAQESHLELLRGDAGTQVSITVVRSGTAADYRLERTAMVIANTQTTVLDGHIGAVTCTSFGENTGTLFREQTQRYTDTVDCWLVDVRGNGGGYSSAAAEAVGAFAGEGPQMYIRDKQGRLYYYDGGEGASTDRPAVILVDAGTASAAEAFAAGMRDQHTGLTVGSRTYGKGTAQVVLDAESFPDYFDGDALKITAYRFYSGGGVTNDGLGVIPTLLVSDDAAYELALAICGGTDAQTEDLLVFYLDGWRFELDRAALSDQTLSALFEALPPGIMLQFWEQGQQCSYGVEEAARRLGVEYNSRWFADAADSRFANAINTLATYGLLQGDAEGNFSPDRVLTRGDACALLGHALGLTGSGTNRFRDLSPEDPNTAYINALAELGLVLGMGDGTFRPDQPVTQQEFYTMLARTARYLSFRVEFTLWDVSQEQLLSAQQAGFRSWAQESVALLSAMNVLNTADGALEPNAAVLREEAAAELFSVLVGADVLPV